MKGLIMFDKLPDNGAKKIIDQEVARRNAALFWRQHVKVIREMAVTDEDSLQALTALTSYQNIGYDEGQIRPGELGKWDVYYTLVDTAYHHERFILSGITTAMARKMDRKIELESAGVDSNNEAEVAEFDRIQNMDPDEIDQEIKKLEQLLATVK